MLSAAFQRFQAHAAAVQTQRAFDRRALPIYVIIIATAAVGGVAMRATGFTIDPSLGFGVPMSLLLFLVAALCARRYGHELIAGYLETLALTGLQGVVLMLILYPLTAISGSFADDVLARLDATIGFDWASLTAALARHPSLTEATFGVYRSFAWQPPLMLALLFYGSRHTRAWQMVYAVTIALGIMCGIYAFFPAEGAFLHSGHHASEFGKFATFKVWDFGSIVHRIKDAGARHVDQSLMGGLVSFPSFHAASAAILAWAAWPTKLRWFFLPLNLAMAVSAIPVGGHYLVDIIAGVAVAGVAIWGSLKVSLRMEPGSTSQARSPTLATA